MIKNNYHTHTYRCGHAIGEDEEYVQEALAMGLSELGFSDHIFLKDHSQPGIRGDYELLEDYISSLEALKEKYKDRIIIYIGLEAEAMDYYYPYYQELLDSGRIQYLLLGNHCEIDKNNNLRPFFSHATTYKDIRRYTKSLIKGMSTGLFTYVCHPDLFMDTYKWNIFSKYYSRKIINASKKYNCPLEFNFGRIRGQQKMIHSELRYGYPYMKFWKMAKRKKAKMILGLDAHSPSDLSNINNDNGYKIVKDFNLDIIQKLDIKGKNEVKKN